MEDEVCLRRAIGLADICELMAASFRFPDEALAEALAGGSYAEDALSCMIDAGVGEEGRKKALAMLCFFRREDADSLLSSLRKGHSLLFLSPGVRVPVWPYESAFRHIAQGLEGVPTLFRSRLTVDVERHMREAGVVPQDSRKEPCDSVWDEFSFLSYLYGSKAAMLSAGSCGEACAWQERIAGFWNDHASQWLPAFMEKAKTEAKLHACGKEYGVLAALGLVVLSAVEADVLDAGSIGGAAGSVSARNVAAGDLADNAADGASACNAVAYDR